MLFDSALRKDLSRTFGAAVTVLLTIVVTILLIKTLGQASRGRVDPSEVMLVLGLTVLGHMTTILALALFITVVGTFSRMHADSEVVIWQGSGLGIGHFVPPVLRFAWPVAAAIFALSLIVWPWSQQQIQQLQQRFAQRSDIERVAPGQFQESASGQRVFFIDKASPGSPEGLNVFVYTQDGDARAITTARQGQIEFRGADKVLVLREGQQVVLEGPSQETRVIGFEDYEIVVDSKVRLSQAGQAARLLPTWQLLLTPTKVHLAELSWRVGMGLACINLLLLGMAMTAYNPRVGRSYHLGLALFAFVAYYNLISVGQSWIQAGSIAFAPMVLGLHGGVAALAGLWLLARHRRWHWRTLWSRPAAQGQPA